MGSKPFLINEAIRVNRVRLVDEESKQVGIIGTEEALQRARAAGLDLVQVAPSADPPVCRIMDYGKQLYQQKRRERQTIKKQHTVIVKEVRLRPKIDPHDLGIKIDRARKFLEKNHRVQFTVLFRGREMVHLEQGHKLMDQIVQILQDAARIDQPSRLGGRRITMVLAPGK